jgi:hypothetical protein
MQGIHEPAASASRWKQLGRQVVSWHNREEVIVPRFVNVPAPELETEGETLEGKRERVAKLIGFKVVRAVVAPSDADGPEIPPQPTSGWDFATALDKLGIREVPFDNTNGKLQG